MPGFVLLAHERGDGDPARRLGITVTKKIGGAVVRNRMKRRFRALARELLPEHGKPGTDYVLIGRSGGIERDFERLREELAKALRKIGNAAALPRKQESRAQRDGTRTPGLLPSREHKKT